MLITTFDLLQFSFFNIFAKPNPYYIYHIIAFALGVPVFAWPFGLYYLFRYVPNQSLSILYKVIIAIIGTVILIPIAFTMLIIHMAP